MSQTKEANTPEDKWEVTTNRYVAFIDIMGFKDMVTRTPHDDMYEMMKKIDKRKRFYEMIFSNKGTDKQVKTVTYSDSIMIYSKNGDADSLSSFMIMVSGFTNDLLTEGIPHKGGVAFGRMTLDFDNSIFFG